MGLSSWNAQYCNTLHVLYNKNVQYKNTKASIAKIRICLKTGLDTKILSKGSPPTSSYTEIYI